MKKIGFLILSGLLSFGLQATECNKVMAEITIKENKKEDSFFDVEMCDLKKEKIYTSKSNFNYKILSEKNEFLNIELDLRNDHFVIYLESNENGKEDRFIGAAKKEFNKKISLKNKNKSYDIKLIK
tara:strand:- start:608 stop:985 length:378 start_codon:yes stop_codon:yes gene_type:complete